MSSKANNSASGGSEASGAHHTQRHTRGGGRRRSSTRRSDAAKGRGTEDHAVAAATVAAIPAAAVPAPATKARGDYHRPPRSTTFRTAARPQQLNEKKQHAQDTAKVTTNANTTTTATATATATKALNALSPEFVPQQHRPSLQHTADVTNALSFSAASSPLTYLGSTGAASSFSSPLMLAASMTHARPSLTSPATPSLLSEQLAAPLSLPAHTSSDPAVVRSTSAMQLRDAYARAAAAKAATATAAASRETPPASLTSPLASPLVRPVSAVPHGVQSVSSSTYTFAVTDGQPLSVPTPYPQPSQRCSAHETVNSIPSVVAAAASTTPAAAAAPAAVYGPSVSVFHPQFIDVATGATSRTPFALHDDYVDEMTLQGNEGEEGAAREVAAMAQEIIDALPLSPQQQQQRYEVEQHQQQQQRDMVVHQQEQQQQQQMLHAIQPRRSCAATVAILASHDAPTAQLCLPATTRRGERPQQQQVQLQQPSSQYTATAYSMEGVASADAATVTARPSPSSQRRTTTTVVTAPAAAAAAAAVSNDAVETAPVVQETPQRRPQKAAMPFHVAADSRHHHHSSVNSGGATTVERLYTCLANTDERTEGGRSAASKMGLTGSVRRAAQPRRGGGSECDDDNDVRGSNASEERSEVATPTMTPAKVLAVEGSPFVAAAAADTASAAAAAATVSTTVADVPRPKHHLLTEEDNAIVFSELAKGDAPRGPRPSAAAPATASTGGSGHLQRAMIQLMAQIQTNNRKVTAASANPIPTTTTTTTAAVAAAAKSAPAATAAVTAGTPKKSSTATAFTTPEVERVPSARPSASKNSTCRTITTIITTPKNTHGRSTSDTPSTAASKGAQRSLASCLEAIAPVKNVVRSDGGGASSLPGSTTITTTSRLVMVRQAAPNNNVKSVATESVAAPTLSMSMSQPSATHVNPSAMPVPRSQRRGGRQASPNHSTFSTGPVNNSSMASSTTTMATTATAASMTAVTSPLMASFSAVAGTAAPATQYAVVIDGHMGRRVTAVSATPLKAGVCVLFEEDRGIDLGRVVQCTTLEDSQAAAGGLPTLASATSPLCRKDRPAPVLRPATAEEEYRWLYADVREAEATLEPCREAATRLGLPVKVVGAVYQFNKAKLTFYYESDTRVDFRSLLPSLFSRFHCRIWMERVEVSDRDAAPTLMA